jgi:hypothetical protein
MRPASQATASPGFGLIQVFLQSPAPLFSPWEYKIKRIRLRILIIIVFSPCLSMGYAKLCLHALSFEISSGCVTGCFPEGPSPIRAKRYNLAGALQHLRQIDTPPIDLIRTNVVIPAQWPGPYVTVNIGRQPGDADASVNGRRAGR